MDDLPFLKKVDDNLILDKKPAILTDPNTQKYMASIMQQQIMHNITPPPKPDFIIKNPNEKTERLLEEANNKSEKQIKLLEEKLQSEKESNIELQNKLDGTYIQLRQLNDKESSQNLYIKELKADLKVASLQKEIAESKLSTKDWKTAFIALVSALFVLAIEHWKDIYNFIISLVELQ